MDDPNFLEPSTINGLNLYAYCLNNPVMNVDPDGRSWLRNLFRPKISLPSNGVSTTPLIPPNIINPPTGGGSQWSPNFTIPLLGGRTLKTGPQFDYWPDFIFNNFPYDNNSNRNSFLGDFFDRARYRTRNWIGEAFYTIVDWLYDLFQVSRNRVHFIFHIRQPIHRSGFNPFI